MTERCTIAELRKKLLAFPQDSTWSGFDDESITIRHQGREIGAIESTGEVTYFGPKERERAIEQAGHAQ